MSLSACGSVRVAPHTKSGSAQPVDSSITIWSHRRGDDGAGWRASGCGWAGARAAARARARAALQHPCRPRVAENGCFSAENGGFRKRSATCSSKNVGIGRNASTVFAPGKTGPVAKFLQIYLSESRFQAKLISMHNSIVFLFPQILNVL